jgi:uncharacterized protein YggE
MKTLSFVTLFLFSCLAFANTSLPNNRHIALEGKAEINAIPDMAIIYFEVSKNNPTSLGAKQEIDAIINAFLNNVGDFGVKEPDISASSISTSQDYKYVENEPVPNGFLASRDIEVTLKDINQLSSFVDYALKNSINELKRIQLASSKASALKQKVNQLAIKDAKDKAKTLAIAFGASLGEIYSIHTLNENSNYAYGARGIIAEGFGGGMVTMNKPAKYLQERITFSASINVVFDLVVK